MNKPAIEDAAEIETLTPNGFRILHLGTSSGGFEHTFRVTSDEAESGIEYVVRVAPAAVERMKQFTGSRHQAGGSFWASRAEDLLAAVLWAEGRLPPPGALTVKDFSRIELDVALAWPANGG